MSIQDRMARLSVATFVIAGLLLGGILVGVFFNSWLAGNPPNGSDANALAAAQRAYTPRDDGSDLAVTTMEMIAPNVPSGQLFDDFDKIIVDVERDGSILVFGESMAVAKFRAMLRDQLTDHAKTMVTIRPDENCLFRHIEQVIQVCDECDIHHQTITNPNAVAPAATISRGRNI
jgi:hypothetical protein